MRQVRRWGGDCGNGLCILCRARNVTERQVHVSCYRALAHAVASRDDVITDRTLCRMFMFRVAYSCWCSTLTDFSPAAEKGHRFARQRVREYLDLSRDVALDT